MLSDTERNDIAFKTLSKWNCSKSKYLLNFEEMLEKEKNNFVEFRYLMFSDRDKTDKYTCCPFLKELSKVLKDKCLSAYEKLG